MSNEIRNNQAIEPQVNIEEASESRKISAPKRIMMFFKFILLSILTVFIALFFFYFVIYLVPEIQEIGKGKGNLLSSSQELKDEPAYKKQIALIEKDVQRLSKKISTLTPWQPYIIISTTKNRFFLYQNKKMVREGYCSSGSYTLLMTEGPKKWIFKTPKGRFRILSKMIDPVWKKPDWAFVEEGLPIPSANDDSRFEYGVLGDYALEIGDGYMIHGTIYKRFLGMPVTHGCIRLNDDDLEAIYKTLEFGSKVYIY